MEQKRIQLTNSKIRDVVQIGLMAAIIFVATWVIHVPSYMGVIHLGDSMVFVSAILLGKKNAAVASAIGMSLFDLLSGYTVWAPFTFIIKGTMAYIAASIAYRHAYDGNKFWNNILAFMIGGIFMISAYYLGGIIILTLLSGSDSIILKQALIIALKDIPGNILQVVAGIIIALPMGKALKKANVVK